MPVTSGVKYFLYLYRITNQFFYKMILISFSIALIAIVFGAKFLSQSQKENLGALYKYLAWFVIAMGFCVLLCDGARGLLRCCNRMQNGGMMRKEMMMNRGMGGPMGMRMMGRGMNCGNNCCGGMMNCGDNSNCCDGGNMDCHDGGMNSSSKGMSPSCPMMGNGMKCTADSGKSGK
jgi:hypothetical protein